MAPFSEEVIDKRRVMVAVAAVRAAPASVQVTPGRTVKEVAVVISAAVLVQDVPHLGLKERHVHISHRDNKVQFVSEVVVKVPNHVQKAQRNTVNHLPGGPPAIGSSWVLTLRPRNSNLLEGKDVLVPGVTCREVLHGIEVTAGAQHFGYSGQRAVTSSSSSLFILTLLSQPQGVSYLRSEDINMNLETALVLDQAEHTQILTHVPRHRALTKLQTLYNGAEGHIQKDRSDMILLWTRTRPFRNNQDPNQSRANTRVPRRDQSRRPSHRSRHNLPPPPPPPRPPPPDTSPPGSMKPEDEMLESKGLKYCSHSKNKNRFVMQTPTGTSETCSDLPESSWRSRSQSTKMLQEINFSTSLRIKAAKTFCKPWSWTVRQPPWLQQTSGVSTALVSPHTPAAAAASLCLRLTFLTIFSSKLELLTVSEQLDLTVFIALIFHDPSTSVLSDF
ncbi:hypothetical protein INR49_029187 [Caranx melampygus]|nr:hypothetical protein INR49_029187 [Caranx melampygus]